MNVKLLPIRDLVQPVVSSVPTASSVDGTFTYLDLSSVNQVRKELQKPAPLPVVQAPSRARQLVKAGDVLVATVRPNLNGVAMVPPDLDGATASTGFCVLRTSADLDNGYLFHWVRSPGFVTDMVRKATGASYPAVSDRIVKSSSIPLPALIEQRRIAEVLDRADAMRAKRRDAITVLEDLTQSIFVDMFGDPDAARPELVPLETLCSRITDGTHQSPKWTSEGVPFVFISNMVSGEIELDTAKYVSKSTHADLTRRCPIEKGDVLYSTVGWSYGIPAVVRTDRPFAFQRHIAHLKPLNSVAPDFLAAMLATPGVRRQADRAVRGAAQPTINLADIRKFRVVAASVPEQQRFAQAASSVRTHQGIYTAALRETQRLISSLQQRAFSGKL